MKKILILIVLFVLVIIVVVTRGDNKPLESPSEGRTWVIKSIDTMKYSRDLTYEKLSDKSFDVVIDAHIAAFQSAGTTHVAIGTPYDEIFNPYLTRWVKKARDKDLNVWFRGNFSGWEGWFGFEQNLTPEEHIRLTREFIKENRALFRDGDVFSPCPECENGGPGDPRFDTDVGDYRRFLIEERQSAIEEFEKIDKDVVVFNSMNFDVAKLVMDQKTAQSLGNLVAIDHYVESPQRLSEDIDLLQSQTGAAIVLGEFGVPIPDIHGNLSEEEQARWIDEALALISKKESVIGLNYWVGVGGSTAIFNDDLSNRQAAAILSKYFNLRF